MGLRPILLAVIVSTVLWPPVAWLRRHRWPSALAAATVMVSALLAVGAVLYATARPIVGQTAELASSAADGLQRVQDWLSGPPLNVSGQRLDSLVTAAGDRLRDSAAEIASGVSAVSSTVITTVLVLVLAFLFVKDGPAFLPWLRRWTGPTIGAHLTEVLARAWETLGSFIRVQALVSFVDAVLIGLGLMLLGRAAGAGVGGADLHLESNVLQPFLQGRSLNLNAAVVLLAVTAGGTLYGIIGAFLAVPVTAVGATVLRYISEQTALRAGEIEADEVSPEDSPGSGCGRGGRAGRCPSRTVSCAGQG